MRYSRFRATVSNTEGRSTKNKSGDKGRISKSRPRKEGSVKSESGAGHIKNEFSHHAPLSHYSPASTTSPYLSDNRDDFSARFLTPCSDDMATGLSVNPATVETISRVQNPADFSPPLDFMDPTGNMHSPNFSAFDDAAFDMANFTADSQAAHNFEDSHPDWSDRLQPHY